MDKGQQIATLIEADKGPWRKVVFGELVRRTFMKQARTVTSKSHDEIKAFLARRGLKHTKTSSLAWLYEQVFDAYRNRGERFIEETRIGTQVAFLILSGMTTDELADELELKEKLEWLWTEQES
jgi:hypothetical protein